MTLDHARAELHAMMAAAPERPGRVRLKRGERVDALVVDNPTARNALTVQMMVDLADAVIELRTRPTAWLVLRSSAPGMFCAGGHLGDVRAALASAAAGERMCLAMSAVLDGLLALPQTSVAVVDGPAVGGGAELATAADLRLVTPSGWLQFRQAALGVATGWGGAARLTSLLGRRTAVRLLTLGERVGPERALALGLADLEGQAADVERMLPGSPPAAVRASKAQVLAAVGGEGAGRQAALFGSVWAGPAHLEALAGVEEG